MYNFKTSLQNLATGIQQNKQNTHKSMSTLGTIVYNSDLFSDINMINTMAAALYFHEQQKVWCVLAMEQGKTFVEVCQEFGVKYANAGPGFKRDLPSCKKTVARYTVN